MLKKGSIVLSIWCGINFILAFIILCYVIVLKQNSPILEVASFSEDEIASLSAKTIAAVNCFTILYNSCSLVVSVLTWPLIRKNLIAGQKWAFLALLFVIGFIDVMAFFASSFSGYNGGLWQARGGGVERQRADNARRAGKPPQPGISRDGRTTEPGGPQQCQSRCKRRRSSSPITSVSRATRARPKCRSRCSPRASTA